MTNVSAVLANDGWIGVPVGHVEEHFTIGDLSREFGVTLRALRFYEDKGLLKPHRQSNVRIYSRRDRDRLQMILQGKRMGFTLTEIKTMIAAHEGTPEAKPEFGLTREKCLEQLHILEKQKADIEQAISELHRTYQNLIG